MTLQKWAPADTARYECQTALDTGPECDFERKRQPFCQYQQTDAASTLPYRIKESFLRVRGDLLRENIFVFAAALQVPAAKDKSCLGGLLDEISKQKSETKLSPSQSAQHVQAIEHRNSRDLRQYLSRQV